MKIFAFGPRARVLPCAGLLVLLASTILSGPAEAESSSPQALVKSVYATYAKPGARGMPADEASLRTFMEPALAKAWAANAKAGETSQDLEGVVDFDPFVGGQDFKIGDLRVGAPVLRNGHADVVATFRNFGKPVRVLYDLVPAGAEWRIFDLHRSGDPSLRHLLKLDAGAPQG